MTDNLKGAEMKEFQERVKVETLRQLDQIKLRQWCVEKTKDIMVVAAAHMGGKITSINVYDNSKPHEATVEPTPTGIVLMARDMAQFFYDFITTVN